MAIKKMNRISIVGPIEEFDGIIDKYVVGTNIHIEDVKKMMYNTEGLYGFEESNPYAGNYRKIIDLCQAINLNPEFLDTHQNIENIRIDEYAKKIKTDYTDYKNRIEELETMVNDNLILIRQLETMGDINQNLEHMFKFEFMRFRFGRLTRDAYFKLKTFLSDLDAIFVVGKKEERYVYGMYLTPRIKSDEVDDVFRTLNFERIRISDRATGTPKEAIAKLESENAQLTQKTTDLNDEITKLIEENKNIIFSLYSFYKRKYDVFSLREYAMHTAESFYIVGWASKKDAENLAKRIRAEKDKVVISKIEQDVGHFGPPTVLKNPKIFEPFESLVKMYALPSYNEIDPTPILAITYTIMFGMMFGDVGQGLLLSALGWLLYKIKKIDLGAIIGMVGLSAAFFGLLYGSVFGIEYEGLWLNPMENTTTILITAIAAGIVLVIMSMGINVINSIKTKKFGNLLFSHNGIAGIIFYVSAVVVAYLKIIQGKNLPLIALIALFGIPLVAMMLKLPLSNLIKGKKKLFDTDVGEYLAEAFFEIFEIILSYITNTISFIRIGAFALVHAGMMLVVYTLAGMMGNVSGGIVAVLGNIFVMALEAFLVGIQSLRLEFYELFSRFYSGEGKEFQPLDIKKIK